MKFVLLLMLVFFVSCGEDNKSTSVESSLNSEEPNISLVFKDNYVVCYLSDQSELSCRNKNKVFPIFMNLLDDSGEKTLKILPEEESTISVNELIEIERKIIELWDECKQPNAPASCN